jgi:hypothetical protein
VERAGGKKSDNASAFSSPWFVFAGTEGREEGNCVGSFVAGINDDDGAGGDEAVKKGWRRPTVFAPRRRMVPPLRCSLARSLASKCRGVACYQIAKKVTSEPFVWDS